jgi:myosin-5
MSTEGALSTTTGDDKALELYSKGTRAWFRDDSEGWVLGILSTQSVNDSHVKLVFEAAETPERVRSSY